MGLPAKVKNNPMTPVLYVTIGLGVAWVIVIAIKEDGESYWKQILGFVLCLWLWPILVSALVTAALLKFLLKP